MGSNDRTLLTIKDFHDKHNSFPVGGLRHLIFYSQPRINSRGETVPGNGMDEFDVIVRLGRKVLIDEDKFFAWLDSQQTKQVVG